MKIKSSCQIQTLGHISLKVNDVERLPSVQTFDHRDVIRGEESSYYVQLKSKHSYVEINKYMCISSI